LINIVKLQFHTADKLYDFSCGTLELVPGDKVVVETERGRSLATVVTRPLAFAESDVPDGLKSVLRKASPDDLALAARNNARERETHAFCVAKIQERGLEMKLVKVEYLFDGSKAIFYFTADGRIDFRELVKDLAHQFHTRIEMRQIGVRDEAKMVGGIGICGRELCCSTFLRDFAPVSVKMAKEQSLALNPAKISGQCGRLLCCLGYEFDTYCSLKKCLPKCGKHVQCGGVSGEVVKLDIFNSTFTVRTADDRLVACHADDAREETAPEAVKKPAREQDRGQPGGKQEGKDRPRDNKGGGAGGGGKRRRDRSRGQQDKEKKETR
jgi:cell fate regulator YaaT (PSP1 superfamily)